MAHGNTAAAAVLQCFETELISVAVSPSPKLRIPLSTLCPRPTATAALQPPFAAVLPRPAPASYPGTVASCCRAPWAAGAMRREACTAGCTAAGAPLSDPLTAPGRETSTLFTGYTLPRWVFGGRPHGGLPPPPALPPPTSPQVAASAAESAAALQAWEETDERTRQMGYALGATPPYVGDVGDEEFEEEEEEVYDAYRPFKLLLAGGMPLLVGDCGCTATGTLVAPGDETCACTHSRP